MKLYTEEQVKFAMLSSYLTGVSRPPSYEEVEETIFNSLTPIELPSDEEIENKLNNSIPLFHIIGFKMGAKWMKKQILNQNK